MVVVKAAIRHQNVLVAVAHFLLQSRTCRLVTVSPLACPPSSIPVFVFVVVAFVWSPLHLALAERHF